MFLRDGVNIVKMQPGSLIERFDEAGFQDKDFAEEKISYFQSFLGYVSQFITSYADKDDDPSVAMHLANKYEIEMQYYKTPPREIIHHYIQKFDDKIFSMEIGFTLLQESIENYPSIKQAANSTLSINLPEINALGRVAIFVASTVTKVYYYHNTFHFEFLRTMLYGMRASIIDTQDIIKIPISNLKEV